MKALNRSAEMHSTLHFSTWSRSDPAASSAFFTCSRISSNLALERGVDEDLAGLRIEGRHARDEHHVAGAGAGGRGSDVVGYNVQVAVETEHHLIVAHEVTNDGSDRALLANIACQAKAVLGVDELEAVADRGYDNSEEILTCDKAEPR